jgi:hypothetical protein
VCFTIGDGGPAGTVFQNLGSVAHCDATVVSSVPASVLGAASAIAGGGWARAW